MSKLLIALLIIAGLGLGGCAAQRDAQRTASRPVTPMAPITKDAYDVAIKNADSQSKIDRDACATRTATAKDICLADANGQ